MKYSLGRQMWRHSEAAERLPSSRVSTLDLIETVLRVIAIILELGGQLVVGRVQTGPADFLCPHFTM